MRAASPGPWPVVAMVCGVLLPAGAARTRAQPAAASAPHSWADGNAAAALEALEAAPRTREAEVNTAVVRLYHGQAREAAAALSALRVRHPGWTPPLRWLARAQAALGQPEALDNARALLARPDADTVDRIW